MPEEVASGGYDAGTVFIGVAADIDPLYAAIDTIPARVAQIPDLKIKVSADHSELKRLNEHIELKRSHVTEVQQWLDRNPLTVRQNSAAVQGVTADLTALKAQLDRSFALNFDATAARAELDAIRTQADAIASEPRTIHYSAFLDDTVAREKIEGLKQTLDQVIRLDVEQKISIQSNELDSTIGRQNGLFTKNIEKILKDANKQGFLERIGSVLTAPIRAVGQSLLQVGVGAVRAVGEAAVKPFEDTIGKKARPVVDLVGKQSERVVQTGTVALARFSGYESTSKFRAETFEKIENLTDFNPRKVFKAAKKFEDNFVSVMESFYIENDSQAAINKVKAYSKEIIEQPLQTLFEMAGVGLRVAAQPFRIRKRVELSRTIKEAEGMVDEILAQMSDELKEQIKAARGVTIATGGINYEKGGENTYFSANLVRKLTPGNVTIPVPNAYSNDPSTLGGLYQARQSIFPGAPMPVDRLLQTSVETGRNPDAARMLAQALAVRRISPESPITFTGSSGGAALVEEVIGAAERAGLQKIKGVGLTLPGFDLTRTASKKNYQTLVGSYDPIAVAAFGGRFDDNSKYFQKAIAATPFNANGLLNPGAATSVFPALGMGHHLADFLANENVQKKFQSFAGTGNIDPGYTGDRKNFGFANQLYSESQAIPRTIGVILGELKALAEVAKGEYSFIDPAHPEYRRDNDFEAMSQNFERLKVQGADLPEYEKFLGFLRDFKRELTSFYETGALKEGTIPQKLKETAERGKEFFKFREGTYQPKFSPGFQVINSQEELQPRSFQKELPKFQIIQDQKLENAFDEKLFYEFQSIDNAAENAKGKITKYIQTTSIEQASVTPLAYNTAKFETQAGQSLRQKTYDTQFQNKVFTEDRDRPISPSSVVGANPLLENFQKFGRYLSSEVFRNFQQMIFQVDIAGKTYEFATPSVNEFRATIRNTNTQLQSVNNQLRSMFSQAQQLERAMAGNLPDLYRQTISSSAGESFELAGGFAKSQLQLLNRNVTLQLQELYTRIEGGFENAAANSGRYQAILDRTLTNLFVRAINDFQKLSAAEQALFERLPLKAGYIAKFALQGAAIAASPLALPAAGAGASQGAQLVEPVANLLQGAAQLAGKVPFAGQELEIGINALRSGIVEFVVNAASSIGAASAGAVGAGAANLAMAPANENIKKFAAERQNVAALPGSAQKKLAQSVLSQDDFVQAIFEAKESSEIIRTLTENAIIPAKQLYKIARKLGSSIPARASKADVLQEVENLSPELDKLQAATIQTYRQLKNVTREERQSITAQYETFASTVRAERSSLLASPLTDDEITQGLKELAEKINEFAVFVNVNKTQLNSLNRLKEVTLEEAANVSRPAQRAPVQVIGPDDKPLEIAPKAESQKVPIEVQPRITNERAVDASAQNVGRRIPEGISRGIAAGEKGALQDILDLARALVLVTEDALQIKSPSRVFRDRVGVNITKGIAQGVALGKTQVVEAVKSLSSELVAASQSELEIRSPSGKTDKKIGRPFGEGILRGILSTKDAIIKAVIDITSGANTAIEGKIKPDGVVDRGSLERLDRQVITNRPKFLEEHKTENLQALVRDNPPLAQLQARADQDLYKALNNVVRRNPPIPQPLPPRDRIPDPFTESDYVIPKARPRDLEFQGQFALPSAEMRAAAKNDELRQFYAGARRPAAPEIDDRAARQKAYDSGEKIGQAVGAGIKAGAKFAGKATKEVIDKIPEDIKGKITSIPDLFQGLFSGLKSQFNDLREELPLFGKITDGIKGIAIAAGAGFIGYQGLQILQDQALKSYEAIKQLQTVRISLDISTKGQGAETLDALTKRAETLGGNIDQIRQNYSQFSASLRDTPNDLQIGRLSSAFDTTAIGLQLGPDLTERARTQITQIASKPKVATEDLRTLSESLPGAYQLSARALNITTGELSKLLETGQLTSEEFLKPFINVLNREFSGSLINASTSLQSAENRLATANKKFLEIGEKAAPIAATGLNVLAGVLNFVVDNSDKLGLALQLTVLGGLTLVGKAVTPLIGQMVALATETLLYNGIIKTSAAGNILWGATFANVGSGALTLTKTLALGAIQFGAIALAAKLAADTIGSFGDKSGNSGEALKISTRELKAYEENLKKIGYLRDKDGKGKLAPTKSKGEYTNVAELFGDTGEDIGKAEELKQRKQKFRKLPLDSIVEPLLNPIGLSRQSVSDLIGKGDFRYTDNLEKAVSQRLENAQKEAKNSQDLAKKARQVISEAGGDITKIKPQAYNETADTIVKEQARLKTLLESAESLGEANIYQKQIKDLDGLAKQFTKLEQPTLNLARAFKELDTINKRAESSIAKRESDTSDLRGAGSISDFQAQNQNIQTVIEERQKQADSAKAAFEKLRDYLRTPEYKKLADEGKVNATEDETKLLDAEKNFYSKRQELGDNLVKARELQYNRRSELLQREAAQQERSQSLLESRRRVVTTNRDANLSLGLAARIVNPQSFRLRQIGNTQDDAQSSISEQVQRRKDALKNLKQAESDLRRINPNDEQQYEQGKQTVAQYKQAVLAADAEINNQRKTYFEAEKQRQEELLSQAGQFIDLIARRDEIAIATRIQANDKLGAAQKRASDNAINGLERESKLISRQKDLTAELLRQQETRAAGRVSGIKTAEDLARQVKDLDPNKKEETAEQKEQKRGRLTGILRNLGLGTDEEKIFRRRVDSENELAKSKADGLAAELAGAQKTLEIELKKEESARRRAVQEAQSAERAAKLNVDKAGIGVEQAQTQLEAAQPSGDPLKVQEAQLNLKQARLDFNAAANELPGTTNAVNQALLDLAASIQDSDLQRSLNAAQGQSKRTQFGLEERDRLIATQIDAANKGFRFGKVGDRFVRPIDQSGVVQTRQDSQVAGITLKNDPRYTGRPEVGDRAANNIYTIPTYGLGLKRGEALGGLERFNGLGPLNTSGLPPYQSPDFSKLRSFDMGTATRQPDVGQQLDSNGVIVELLGKIANLEQIVADKMTVISSRTPVQNVTIEAKDKDEVEDVLSFRGM